MNIAKPILQFSHANGFPAPCYRQLFERLEGRFDIRWVDRFGHDPDYPVTDGWHKLTDQLVHAVEAHRHPVIAVGHSLGGFLSLRAAVRRPDLFRGVVLLDATILSRMKGGALAFTKKVGIAEKLGPAPGTLFRRREWDTPGDALAYFQTKTVFRRFDPRCLEDYVTFGTEAAGDRIRLRFTPEIENRIYQTLPHDLVQDCTQLAVPAGLVYGEQSDLTRRVGLSASERWMKVAPTRGGHLFPFQFPESAALAITRMIGELGLGA
jgi:pimeloyl-ACP methyl ester carboxylesterase